MSGKEKREPQGLTSRDYAVDLLRAFGGAIIFAFPLLMTMEMWQLGFSMGRWRLVLFLLMNLVLLEGLAFVAGFRRAFSLKDDTLDALAAFGVGVFASAALLVALDLISWGMTADEVIGKIAVQAVPASIGAMASRRQLGDSEDEDERPDSLRRRAVPDGGGRAVPGLQRGAYRRDDPDRLRDDALARDRDGRGVDPGAARLCLLAGVLGPGGLARRGRVLAKLLGYSLAGDGIALLVSLYALWTFGRVDGVAPGQVAMMVTVLGFPASLGAAIARLVV